MPLPQRLDHDWLRRRPDFAPRHGEWSALALVDGFAVYRETATFRVAGDSIERYPTTEVDRNPMVVGFIEHRLPATAVLAWRSAEEQMDLLATLSRPVAEWRLSIDPSFAGNLKCAMDWQTEDSETRTQHRFATGPGQVLEPVRDSDLVSETRSGEEVGVGFLVTEIIEGALAWRADLGIDSVSLGTGELWGTELLVRLGAACGAEVPSRYGIGVELPSSTLMSIRVAAESCRSRVLQAIDAKASESRSRSESAKACTTALLLDRLCELPSPPTRAALLLRRADAREDLGKRSAALADATRSFRIARRIGNHRDAAKAAFIAYRVDDDSRSGRWARRARSAAAAARSLDDWALAKELLGDTLRRSGREVPAIACYEQSLRALRRWNAAPARRLARVYREIATCRDKLDDRAGQVAAERECYRLYRLDGYMEAAARSALRLAYAHWITEQSNDAYHWSRQAIDLADHCEDADLLGEAHSMAGRALEQAKDAEGSLRHCLAAIEHYSSLERLPHETLGWLHERAAECDALENLDQQRMHSELAVREFDLAGRRSYAVEALHRLCRIAWEEDRDADAIAWAQDAMTRAKGRSERALSMMVLGEALARVGRVEDAMAQFNRAAPLNRRIRPLSPDWSAHFHRKLAEVCRDAGKTAEAEKEEHTCLECCKEAGDWEGAAETAIRLAGDAASREDPTTAQAWHDEAVRFARQSGDAGLLALTLELQGDSRQSARDPKAALACYRKSLRTLESWDAATSERLGRVLREIMYCEEDLERWEDAARAGTSAVENFRSDECWFEAAGTCDELAVIALERNDEAERRRWHERTLEFAHRCESVGELALVYEWIGSTLRTYERPSDAIPYLAESLLMLTAWPDATPSRIASVHGELARCHARLGDYQAAKDSALAALKGHSDAEEPIEAVDLVESLDSAFLADKIANAIMVEAMRLAEESRDEELIRRLQTLQVA
jgi:tetratricopeptide (TPR) repeat protein